MMRTPDGHGRLELSRFLAACRRGSPERSGERPRLPTRHVRRGRLLGDGEITTRASPKSTRLEQPLQVMQAVCRDSWRPECSHCRANPGVKHPRRKCCYDARFDLNVEDGSASPLLAVVSSGTVAVKRMPRIVNYNFSPDMGRMTT
jgi:hypothetical protein